MTDDYGKNVKFMGNQRHRDEMIRFVDSVLKKNGNFEDFADLSGGMDSVADSYLFHIVDDDDSFAVKVESLSGTGASLQFVIDKGTKTIYRPVDETQHTQGDENIDFLDDL